MVRIRTVAKMGRRTLILASHCMAASSLHPRAVAHVGGQVCHHRLAGLEAAQDRHLAVLGLGRLYQAVLQPAALRSAVWGTAGSDCSPSATFAVTNMPGRRSCP